MERKLATVLFVDLVDSTSFVSASDPEVVRRRVTQFFDRVSSSIERYGGTVEKFAGDAVMAAFGVPQAHEDDSERAVRAALEILDGVDQLELQARIGVEAGEVVTGAGDSTFATGEAVNIAARLQQLAEPGQILLGPAAHRLTLGRIEVDDVGPVEVRGRDEPVWAWAATGAGGRAPARVAVTPLVGRDHELDLLENTFARATRDRRAHLVTIYGEPGVGKSRLANEFLASLEGTTILHGPLSPVRREHHVLAARRDGQGRGRHRGRRPARRRDREAARVLPGRGGRRPARARDRRARGRPRRAQPAGDLLGGARVGAGDVADAAADPRLRGHPLGGGAAARADRAHDRRGSATAR